jgi:hypothetical protein
LSYSFTFPTFLSIHLHGKTCIPLVSLVEKGRLIGLYQVLLNQGVIANSLNRCTKTSFSEQPPNRCSAKMYLINGLFLDYSKLNYLFSKL